MFAQAPFPLFTRFRGLLVILGNQDSIGFARCEFAFSKVTEKLNAVGVFLAVEVVIRFERILVASRAAPPERCALTRNRVLADELAARNAAFAIELHGCASRQSRPGRGPRSRPTPQPRANRRGRSCACCCQASRTWG